MASCCELRPQPMAIVARHAEEPVRLYICRVSCLWFSNMHAGRFPHSRHGSSSNDVIWQRRRPSNKRNHACPQHGLLLWLPPCVFAGFLTVLKFDITGNFGFFGLVDRSRTVGDVQFSVLGWCSYFNPILFFLTMSKVNLTWSLFQGGILIS